MTAIVKWRIFESLYGHRFVMGETTNGAAKGPIGLKSFDVSTMRVGDFELVDPPAYSDHVQYELENAWSMCREVRDVTATACRELGVDEKLFDSYHDGWTPRKE